VSALTREVAALFAAPRTDTGVMQVALKIEQVAAMAYATAADGPLAGEEAAVALRFAEHERRHAAAFETMLFALTVPVRERASGEDLDSLLPGLRGAGRREALQGLAELEGAAIAGHLLIGRRLVALDALRTVATVMAGGAQHLVVLRDALGVAPLSETYETGM
jgi:ferric-dicitrate binding protein FerR (iron transport regulator)